MDGITRVITTDKTLSIISFGYVERNGTAAATTKLHAMRLYINLEVGRTV